MDGKNVVTVIEISDQTTMAIDQMVAFDDDHEGNKKAEEIFRKLVMESYPESENDIEIALEDGYFWKDNYYIMIVHSTGLAKKEEKTS